MNQRKEAFQTIQIEWSQNAEKRTGKRVLIVRLSAIGDAIHGVPVLCALRRAMPDAFIAWVVEGRAADVLSGHPDLDALVRIPRGWLKSFRTVREVRTALRQMKFDTSVDLQCLTKSAIAAWLSGAERRIGVGGSDGRELSKWFNNDLVHFEANHVIEHYLQIAAPLGATLQPVEFKLHESEADKQFAEASLQALFPRSKFSNNIACAKSLSQNRKERNQRPGMAAEQRVVGTGSKNTTEQEQRFAILNAGAGWPSKVWPAERYAAVAKHLASQHNMPSLVVWAGDAERAMAEAIVEQSEHDAQLAPATTLTQLAAISCRAALFIGSDTGPLHLAVAVGTPCVSLHGTTRANWSGAYGNQSRQLQMMHAKGRAKNAKQDNRAMLAIETEHVCEACDEIFSEQKNTGHRAA